MFNPLELDVKSRPRMLLPVCPAWSRRVTGREFAKYMTLARKKPRRSIFLLPIMDPLGKFPTFWGVVTTMTDLSYTAFVVPLSLAFSDSIGINAYFVLDYIGSAVYILDLFLEFHIGFLIRWDASSLTIIDGKRVAWNYFRHGTFWIDFIAVLPIFAQIALKIMADENDVASKDVVRIFLLFKLLRLLRVVHLVARMNNFDQGGLLHQWIAQRFTAVTMFAVNTAFSLMVMINLIACLWWWVAISQGLENSWVGAVQISKPEIDLENASNGVRWAICAYFAMVTMATIGYGDIVPVTTEEVILVLIFSLCGVAYFGFI